MRKKYDKKIIVVYIVLSIFFLCLSTFFFLMNSNFHKNPSLFVSNIQPKIANEDTSSWTKYTDATLNTTVLLPKDWYLHSHEEQSGYSLFISAPVDNKSAQAPKTGQHLALSIWKEDNKNQSIEEWGRDVLINPNEVGPATRNYMFIDGNKALQLHFIDEKNTTLTGVNVGKYRYIISATTIDLPYSAYEGRINLFITSLKFNK